jgi:hypothetical protein
MNTEELIKYFAVTKPHEGEFRQDSFINQSNIVGTTIWWEIYSW